MRFIKYTLLVLGLFIIGLTPVLYIMYDFLKLDYSLNPQTAYISPLAKNITAFTDKLKQGGTSGAFESFTTDLTNQPTVNILLLGIDRRSRAELAYRTDIIILLSINTQTKKAVLTSIPRDLWFSGGKLNGLYISQGWDALKPAIAEITGQPPQRFILTDFEDFKWLVDSMGGVTVPVQISFTDSSYPNDVTKGYQIVSFTQGDEHMTGDRALIFSRSRKGDFDNGDWGRMRRQHLVLKSMLEAATKPKSFLCQLGVASQPNESCENVVTKTNLTNAYTTITQGKLDTNLTLEDLFYLWSLYKDRGTYTTESLLVDYTYLYTPPAQSYGGAWTIVPTGGSFDQLHNDLQAKLNSSVKALTTKPF